MFLIVKLSHSLKYSTEPATFIAKFVLQSQYIKSHTSPMRKLLLTSIYKMI